MPIKNAVDIFSHTTAEFKDFQCHFRFARKFSIHLSEVMKYCSMFWALGLLSNYWVTFEEILDLENLIPREKWLQLFLKTILKIIFFKIILAS